MFPRVTGRAGEEDDFATTVMKLQQGKKLSFLKRGKQGCSRVLQREESPWLRTLGRPMSTPLPSWVT